MIIKLKAYYDDEESRAEIFDLCEVTAFNKKHALLAIDNVLIMVESKTLCQKLKTFKEEFECNNESV